MARWEKNTSRVCKAPHPTLAGVGATEIGPGAQTSERNPLIWGYRAHPDMILLDFSRQAAPTIPTAVWHQ